MIKRYYITLGAGTTAGGKVISASHIDTIAGAGVALEGDRVQCPSCNSEGTIALDGPRLSERYDGREAALGDDLCICGCSPPPRLVASQDFACQTVSADWHALQTQIPGNRSGAGPNCLELGDQVISGTLDQHGATGREERRYARLT